MPSAAGKSSRASSNRFATRAVLKKTAPVMLPPGRLRLATIPYLIGSSPETKRIGISDVAAFAASAGLRASSCYKHRHMTLNQVGRERWQTIIMTFRPPVFDRQVLRHDIAGSSKALSKALHLWRHRCWRPNVKEAHHRYRGLLRTRSERQGSGRRADKRDGFPPPHVLHPGRGQHPTTPLNDALCVTANLGVEW